MSEGRRVSPVGPAPRRRGYSAWWTQSPRVGRLARASTGWVANGRCGGLARRSARRPDLTTECYFEPFLDGVTLAFTITTTLVRGCAPGGVAPGR